MLLAVDTSTPQIGLALYDGSCVLAEMLWTSKTRHTVELAPAVSYLLERADKKMGEILVLGTAIGPGSFTSLRVGLSFIKGLAYSLSIPAVGINTLDVVAAGQNENDLPLLCSIPAGRGRFATGLYQYDPEITSGEILNGWKNNNIPVILTLNELFLSIRENTIVCGEFSKADRLALQLNPNIHLLSPASGMRRPAVLAELAYKRWQTGNIDDVSSIAPNYLHLSDPIPDPITGAKRI